MVLPRKPTIRRAKPSDATATLKYMDCLLGETGVYIPRRRDEFKFTLSQERKILASYAKSKDSTFLVATIGHELVGLLTCNSGKHVANRHAAVLGMSVSRDYRNCGIGGALLGEAIRWARRTGTIRRIELIVYVANKPAVHLYEKHGFRIEGTKIGAVLYNGKYVGEYVMARHIRGS